MHKATIQNSMPYLTYLLIVVDWIILYIFSTYSNPTNIQWATVGVPLAVTALVMSIYSFLKSDRITTKLLTFPGTVFCLITLAYLGWVLFVVKNTHMGV
jgi:hypothetical protein